MVNRFSISQCVPLVVAWGLLTGMGMLGLMLYEGKANTAATAPERWPDEVRLSRNETSATLLLFVHPHCPCSRATLGELERIVARPGGGMSASVVFWHPKGVATDWHQGTLWSYAQTLPGVQLIDDIGSVISRRFGVSTSGQVLVYDSSGQLKYSGGITKARGHSGDSAGSDDVQSIGKLSIDKSSSETPMKCGAVFGCPLSESTVIALSQERAE